jgi:hypothetical protein
MRILVWIADNAFQRKAQYVLTTFLKALGANCRVCTAEEVVGCHESPMDLLLVYAPPDTIMPPGVIPDVWIETSGDALDFFVEYEESRGPSVSTVRFHGHEVPMLFYSDLLSQDFTVWLQSQEQTFRLPWDIVASSFYFLSHWQELVTSRRDIHGRFPYQDHICHKLGCFDRPVVDDYLHMLELVLDKVSRRVGREFYRTTLWPDGRQFAVALTHDVDWIQKFTPRYFLSLLVQPDKLRRDWTQIQGYLRKDKDPYDNIEEIVALERLYKSKSTFFFLAARRNVFDGKCLSANYPPIIPRVAALCKWIESEGGEVGLHSSYLSVDQLAYLREEKEALEAVAQVQGVRQHYLRVDVEKTLGILEAVGLQYDTSLGFSDRVGFRASFSFPYHPYCVAQDRPFNVLEIPLVVMDATLRSEGLCCEEALEKSLSTLETVRASGGCCAVLWHNNIFDAAQYPGYDKVYEGILAWIVEHEGWGTTCRNILACYDRDFSV